MRYYRLWIYASNVVLMASVVVFLSVAAALLADPRRTLLPTSAANLSQSSFVYAYTALVVQGGILPIVGCIGALRLSERLLNAYWLLLLVLLGGDILMGVVWLFRFQKLVAGLVPDLRQRLVSEYGQPDHAEYTRAWDLLQLSARCCGVDSPADYNNSAFASAGWQSISAAEAATASANSKVLLPESCCRAASVGVPQMYPTTPVPPGRKEVYGTIKQQQQSREFAKERMNLEQRLLHATNHNNNNNNAVTVSSATTGSHRHDDHRSRHSPAVTGSGNGLTVASTGGHIRVARPHPTPRPAALSLGPVSQINGSSCARTWPADVSDIHNTTCGQFVLQWLNSTGDNLFVLGFCVLAFVKICFLAILRYELREMVQKIKILRSENVPQVHEITTGILAMGTTASAVTASSGQPPSVVVAADEDTDRQQRSPVASPVASTAAAAPGTLATTHNPFAAVNGDLSFQRSTNQTPSQSQKGAVAVAD